MSLFDPEDDETPPSIGEEIGEALSPALIEMNRLNASVAMTISKALEKSKPKEVKRWVFTVERDKDKLLTKIIATAE